MFFLEAVRQSPVEIQNDTVLRTLYLYTETVYILLNSVMINQTMITLQEVLILGHHIT